MSLLPLVFKRAADKPTVEIKMCDVLVRHSLPLHTEDALKEIMQGRFKKDYPSKEP